MNPSLLRDLEKKLPANICLDWAIYKRRAEVVNLETFSEYMTTIISAVSDVTRYCDLDLAKFKYKEETNKNFENTHSASDSDDQESKRDVDHIQGKHCFAYT